MYTCPVCGEKVDRDLSMFLDHTNMHIIEKLKETHPDWVTGDGCCQKCYEYLEKNRQGVK